MAAYPQNLTEWQALGYTGYDADFQKWKRDMDLLVGLVEDRINVLTMYRRSGVVTVPALTVSQFVTFSSPIISTSYRVFFTVEGPSLASRFTYANQQLTGFTLNAGLLSTGVTLAYLAIVDR